VKKYDDEDDYVNALHGYNHKERKTIIEESEENRTPPPTHPIMFADKSDEVILKSRDVYAIGT
jgi:hypothetical protein